MRYIKWALVLFALLLVINFSDRINPSPKPTPIPTVAPNLNSDTLLENIQKWRTSKNLPRYIVNDSLCDIAKIRLLDIQSDFSHNKFSETTRRYFGNIKYDIGENLADVSLNEKALLDLWINSPEHKENLEKNYKFTCVSASGRYAVQIFGNF